MPENIESARAQTLGSLATWAGAAVLLLGSPAALAAEAPSLLTDSFQVALGTFIITSEPSIQLNGDTSSGDTVDFDEALGGGDSQRIRLDSFWRFGDSGRHKVKAIAFDMSRDNSRTIDEEIDYGGEVSPGERQGRLRVQLRQSTNWPTNRLPEA